MTAMPHQVIYIRYFFQFYFINFYFLLKAQNLLRIPKKIYLKQIQELRLGLRTTTTTATSSITAAVRTDFILLF